LLALIFGMTFKTKVMDAEAVELYHRLIDAWNNRDAEKFSELFTTDGICIGFDGSEMFGRAEINSQLSTIFKDHPTAEYVTLIQEAGRLSNDTLLLRAHVGMVPPGKDELDPSKNTVQIMTVRVLKGRSEILVFQNTPAQFHGRPDDARLFTKLLEEQYAVTHH
jgi:uncharacterized protein (TIGR02246 family)